MHTPREVAAPRRALVVDNDPAGRAFVVEALSFASFVVDEVSDAHEALELVAGNSYDAVVSAIDLPSMSGVTLLRRLRDVGDFAVVIHSSKSDSMFAVVSLEAGADDYCVKPITGRELVLRVEMAIERHRSSNREITAPVVVAADGLVIDPITRLVAVDGVEVDLTVKEFDLLLVLASSPGQVFTRGELLELVWETKPDWQSVDTVTEHVYRVRQKLDVGHGPTPDRIQTVRGAGYRFAQQPAVAPAVPLRSIS